MLQCLANGMIQGLLFAVVGIAFALVQTTTGVFHLALGASYTLAPYVLLGTLHAGLPWFIGGSFALAVAVTLGLASEKLIHWPLERRRAPADVHLISSLGAFLFIGQVIVLIWGNDARVLRPGLDVVYEVAGVRVSGGQVIGAITAIASLVGILAWLQWTNVGLQFRAMAGNSSLLAILGRDIRKLRYGVFGLSGGLAALVAIAGARDIGFDPNVGMRTVLVGVAATIVGGRGSIAGAGAAGLLLGVVRAQVGWHTSARWEDATTFLLLASFLLLVPGGLQGVAAGRVTRLEDGR